MSKFQKRRHRLRLRAVDSVVDTLDLALAKQGQTLPAVERWKAEMPREEEMRPKDKYTMFDRKAKRYRKGIHSEFGFFRSCLDGRFCWIDAKREQKGGGGFGSESRDNQIVPSVANVTFLF